MASFDLEAEALILAGPLSISNDSARVAFGHAVGGLLSHQQCTLDRIERTIEVEPDCGAAWVLRGFAYRLLARRDVWPEIERSLQSASAAFAKTGSIGRELALAQALQEWLRGRPASAAKTLDAQLALAPADPLLAKLAHAVRFMAGDADGMLNSLDAILPAFDAGDPGHAFVLGCRSFALEELRRFDEAEALGREAHALDPRDVWALHAVTHALYETGRFEEGIAWLDHGAATLSGVGNLAGHVAWHEALFHLEGQAPEAALRLLDARIDIYPARDFRDASNIVTLLIQLTEGGFDVSARWNAVADIAELHHEDHVNSFADLHYLIALLFAGREASALRFVDRMETIAQESRGEFDADTMLEVGVPAARAILAAWRGDFGAAQSAIASLEPRLVAIGGSHAQRRLFAWVLAALEGRSS